MFFPFQCHQLAARGEWGLACDDNGLAIGPIELIKRVRPNEPAYAVLPRAKLNGIAEAIYGIHAISRHQWFCERVQAIADAMSKERHVLACISAVQLRLGAFPSEVTLRLCDVALSLKKFNPNWPDEPRDGHGRWTAGGENPIVPVIAPFTPECLAAIETAKRICIGRYTAMGRYTGPDWMMACIRSHVPLECGY
jgi:hypothetical protein